MYLGMSKTDIASISPILMIIGLFLPAIVGHSVSSKPIDILIRSIQFKLVTSVCVWMVTVTVKYAYSMPPPGSVEAGDIAVPEAGYWFYVLLIVVMSAHEIAGSLIFLASISFFAKISDPLIGGTYMTLLNTITNLGSKWPNTLALWILPKVIECSLEFIWIPYDVYGVDIHF